jgi:Phytanoyl-CoA dioxygenase (PhyH)
MILEIIEQDGHVVMGLRPVELAFLRANVRMAFDRRLQAVAPQLYEAFDFVGIEKYHQAVDPASHAKMWPKTARLLPKEVCSEIKEFDFMNHLAPEYGEMTISGEELNWRLVRPNCPEDVGPPHADSWFWEAGSGNQEMPHGAERLKVWIPLYSERGKNGLMVADGSHKKKFNWHKEHRDGYWKPVLDEDPSTLGLELLDIGPGELVIFHDDLLHGGAVNRGEKCRVSLELTLIYFPNAAHTWSTP